MASLHNISVQLSNGQKRNLARAYQRNEEVTLRLSKKSLNGSDTLRVPAQVVKRLQKNGNAGKGMQIKISKANIRKQDGSGIFSSLMPLLKTVAPTIGKTLGYLLLQEQPVKEPVKSLKKSQEDKSFKFLMPIFTN